MISDTHLKHWLSEIEWQLNGIAGEINKKGYGDTDGIMINEGHLSLEYLREKQGTIRRLMGCIREDMIIYDVNFATTLNIFNKIASTDALTEDELKEAVVHV